MPKRPADEDVSPSNKKVRSGGSNGGSRKISVNKPVGMPCTEPEQTPSTISPAMLSDTQPAGILDPNAIRRRLNPDSLAFRLGSDLVKELEALLKPGLTEMPPFAVRQKIQKRYGVDRRHIYDWFHNKGLRVSSAEKRNEQRAAKLNEVRKLEPPDTRIQRRIRTHSEIAAASASASAHSPALNSPRSGSSTPLRSGSTHPTPSPSMSSNLVPYEAACQVHRQHPGYPVHTFGEYYDPGLFSHPSILAYSQMHPAMHGPYLFPTLPEYHGFPIMAGDSFAKTPADRTSNWISEQQKIPYTPDRLVSSPVSAVEKTQQSNLEAMVPLDNEQALPRPQREAFYQSLSDTLPPACGIEESVGTYKAYMNQQVQGYYDRLVSGGAPFPTYECSYPLAPAPKIYPNVSTFAPAPAPYSMSYPRSLYSGSLPPPPQLSAHRPAVTANNDFSNWILYGGRSQAPSSAPSPSQTPSLSETNTSASSALWPPELLDGHTCGRPAVTSLEISDILESPVLRSRHATNNVAHRVAPHGEKYFQHVIRPDLKREQAIFFDDDACSIDRQAMNAT